jgi:hypothetical protein
MNIVKRKSLKKVVHLFDCLPNKEEVLSSLNSTSSLSLLILFFEEIFVAPYLVNITVMNIVKRKSLKKVVHCSPRQI